MTKTVILAELDAPPVVKAIQEKLRKKMGEEKFEELKKRLNR